MNRPKLIPALLVPFAMMASGFAGMASRLPSVTARMNATFAAVRPLPWGPPSTPAAPQAPRNRTRAQRRAARRKKIARGHR